MFSSKVISILAIAATVCFLLLIGLQIWEINGYSAEPSVWPAAQQ